MKKSVAPRMNGRLVDVQQILMDSSSSPSTSYGVQSWRRRLRMVRKWWENR